MNNRDTCFPRESRPHVNQPGNQTFEELNESLQTSGILCKLTEANKITRQIRLKKVEKRGGRGEGKRVQKFSFFSETLEFVTARIPLSSPPFFSFFSFFLIFLSSENHYYLAIRMRDIACKKNVGIITWY